MHTHDALNQRTLADYAELGTRRAQVVNLRQALKRYGQHSEGCGVMQTHGRCTCGLDDALTIGTDAAIACGVKE